jgi:uncharacterized protein (DUF2252 family)
MLEGLMGGYQRAMAAPEHKTADHTHKPRDIQKLLNRSIRRHWQHLARERLADVNPMIPLGQKFWPPTHEELQAARAHFRGDAARDVLTRITTRRNDEHIDLVDLAYRIKGCSSLGRSRYAALVGFGKHHKDGCCLVESKKRLNRLLLAILGVLCREIMRSGS